MPQNYNDHVRWYPLVHFVITPLLLINLAYQAVRLYQEPSWDRSVLVMFSLTIILLSISARLQALKAQDRVIRLEERLRYKEILSPDLFPKASELPPGKMIALRFASDAELPVLISQVLDNKLSTGKEIKAAITDWRGDHLRV